MGASNESFHRAKGVFYHGTFQEFEPGDIITSPAARGQDNPRQGNFYYKPDHVYITPHYDLASPFAERLEDANTRTPKRVRGAVYEVEPIGPKRDDEDARSYGVPKGTSYRVKEARVVRKVVPGEPITRMRRNHQTDKPEPYLGTAD